MGDFDIGTGDDAGAVVERVLGEWLGGPYDNARSINVGECMAFAHEVAGRHGGLEVKTTSDPDVLGPGRKGRPVEPYHVWVYDGDRHYDAETPGGVDDWRDLPFFKRAGY